MKRILSVFLFLIATVFLFSKELAGLDLQAVNTALDAKLYVENYEELEAKLNYLRGVESEIKSYEKELSDEAKLICKSIFILEKENVEATELQKINRNQKKKADKKEKDSATEAMIMNLYKEYEDFAERNVDLSSHFNFHFLETRFSTLTYLSTTEQLKILKNILDDYKKIEEQNPKLSENLFMLGAILYFMPKIAGGNKEEAVEKLKLALNYAACDYEKSSALVLLSQIMYEEKKMDESKKYMNEAIKISPENKTINILYKANEEGYSMFNMDKYLKKQK